jgi:hypothetical protein
VLPNMAQLRAQPLLHHPGVAREPVIHQNPQAGGVGRASPAKTSASHEQLFEKRLQPSVRSIRLLPRPRISPPPTRYPAPSHLPHTRILRRFTWRSVEASPFSDRLYSATHRVYSATRGRGLSSRIFI